jgi:predicted nicotinamide N-methyase
VPEAPSSRPNSTAAGVDGSARAPAPQDDAALVVPPPEDPALEALLDRYAPFQPAPLCPEISAFHARSLVEVWEAAERLAGVVLPAPFWAYPWAGGAALARVLLDSPALAAGWTVLDFGAGGGVATIAAARAGARRAIANDLDPWALATARIAAARQGLDVEAVAGDLTAAGVDALDGVDVLLCSELAYERSAAAPQRALIERARARGILVLLADSGRTYFDSMGMEQVAEFTLRVPRDLEGVDERTARVFMAPHAI